MSVKEKSCSNNCIWASGVRNLTFTAVVAVKDLPPSGSCEWDSPTGDFSYKVYLHGGIARPYFGKSSSRWNYVANSKFYSNLMFSVLTTRKPLSFKCTGLTPWSERYDITSTYTWTLFFECMHLFQRCVWPREQYVTQKNSKGMHFLEYTSLPSWLVLLALNSEVKITNLWLQRM